MEARKKKSSRLLAWVVVIAVAFTMTLPSSFVWAAETGATQEKVVTEDQTPTEAPAVEESSNKDPTEAAKAQTEKKAAKAAATGTEDPTTPGSTEESVASIGDKGYVSLEEAIAAATDKETVKLLKDVTVDKKIVVTGKKAITLDLAEKKITGGDQLFTDEQQHTQPLEVNGAESELTITGNGEINSGKTAFAAVGVMGAGKLTVENGTLVGQYYGIAGNGLAKNSGTEIIIKGGTIKGLATDDNAAVYHPQDGKLAIEGGTLEGATGVQMCAGEGSINITGGKIIATGQDNKANKGEGDGLICDGAAISLVSRNYPGGDPSLTITAGEFTSEHNDAVVAYKWNSDKTWGTWADASDHLKISGGIFSSNPSDYVIAGYKSEQSGDNFIVRALNSSDEESVANIGDKGYASLAEAIAAATDKETVKLLKDVTLESSIAVEAKKLTLDLNGKDINCGYVPLKVMKGADLTIKDSTVKADYVYSEGNYDDYPGGKIYSKTDNGINVIGNEKADTWETAIDSKLTIEGASIDSQEYGIGVYGNGAVLNMNAGYVRARDNAAIAGNGTKDNTTNDGGTTINFNGGALIGEIVSNGYTSCGIYHPQSGNLNINGGTIISTKGPGVVMRNGALDLQKATIDARGDKDLKGKVGDRTYDLIPNGIIVDYAEGYNHNNETKDTRSISISGGNVASKSCEAVYVVKDDGNKIDGINVTGGTFSSNPSDYVTEGYAVNKTKDGYKVSNAEEVNGEAVIGKLYYESLADAIEAAKDGDTVKLNKDLEVSITVPNTGAILINKDITLDGNGKTITATGSENIGHVIQVDSGANAAIKNLTIDGNKVAKHGIQVYSKEEKQSVAKVTSVAVNNCVGYGFMINGGKLNATRITAKDNDWGGVNIGQGTDVDFEPNFIFNSGTLQEKNPIQADNVGDKAPKANWVTFGDNAGTWYATKSVREIDNKTLIQWSNELQGEAQTDGVTYKTFAEALAAAEDNSVVTLMEDIEVDMGTDKNQPAILIDKAITLDGNGKTIKAIGSKTDIGHVIGVQSGGVTIMNLDINGNDTARHGIQTYGSDSAAELQNVQITNCIGYAVVANGSSVTAEGLYTSDNGWGGVNVGKGSGVETDPTFTFKGGDLQENNPIQIDNVGTEDPNADWVDIQLDTEWHYITKKDGDKTIIQFAPGAAITDVVLNADEMSLTEGDKAQLIATIAPENAYDTDVTWTVEDDSDVITVDDNGLVTAVKEGKATVIATAADGEKTAECTITVEKKQEAVKEPVKVVVAPSTTTNEDEETVVNESDVMQAIGNAKEKEEVVVRMPENVAPVLSEEVFVAANESDADKLIVEVPATATTYEATFEFETAAIEKFVEVNTEIKTNDIDDVSTQLPENAAKLGLSLSHEGDFPAPATITITITDENIQVNDTVYIYYLRDGKLQLIDNEPLEVKAGKDGKSKKVTFTLNHASDYVISSEPIEPETAADSVDVLIGKIGAVTYTDDVYQAIKAARDAYNGFKKQYKEASSDLVTKYDTLEKAEASYKALDDQVKAFKAAVDEFPKDKIKGAMTYAQQKEVDKLEAAYNALNIEQKEALQRDAFDEDYTYEEIYQELGNIRDASKDAETVSQANRVSKLVEQLPATATYSAADKSKIDAARNMYNSVVAETPAAKQLLENELNKIQKAETEYRNAKRTAYNNARISLSTTQYTYTGGAKTPAVYGLSAFVNGRDYSVAYRNNVKTGKATVTVTAIGDCAGLSAKTATFRITPAKAAISKLKKGKKSFKVTIKSQKSAGVSGYQISYSLKKNKSFKSTTTTKTSKTVKKLKAKKTYYVKVRSYKTIDGKKYYGAYSKVKKIKTK
ncbi:Ig-like domain-containing protein [Anaerovorax odorimutans]|uniref:Ig-like domain-containing protein n=1 Tax=Anaerovorax odorimutans TaxID=109327 RepID=A0ABT1RJI0_9FIRM|nr:Ig-like domain-containing protein [Anaerovorax odorimutans]MCQ4635334.1 Ig-like domain-containing protein [Anaerovorax odorimutans]